MKQLFLGVFSAAILLSSCNSNDKKAPVQTADTGVTKSPDSTTADIKQGSDEAQAPDPNLNGIAKIVAGVTDDQTIFKTIAAYPGFVNYSGGMSKSFDQFEEKMLNRFRGWSKTELADLQKKAKTVFYPFSGPDIGFAYSLCPDADNYFMFGLEPVGRVPSITQTSSEADIETILKAMEASVHDNMNYSYFISKNMKVDFRQSLVKGTTPVLFFYMANLGLQIVSVDFINIGETGELEKAVSEDSAKGVKIGFFDPARPSKLRYVHYFGENIGNNNPGFMGRLDQMCSKMPDMITFVKSSSYCMHSPVAYKSIRDIVLKYSQALIQDDTGVPFSYLQENSEWQLSLYGKYNRPISIFSGMFQRKFKEAMETAKPIDFKFGYNTPSNILVARKSVKN